jgi:plasmid replication initiation protein
MGINLEQYPRPNSLRERCIDVGIEEINTNAGYKLSYKQNKDGKNITGLTFFLLDEKE